MIPMPDSPSPSPPRHNVETGRLRRCAEALHSLDSLARRHNATSDTMRRSLRVLTMATAAGSSAPRPKKTRRKSARFAEAADLENVANASAAPAATPAPKRTRRSMRFSAANHAENVDTNPAQRKSARVADKSSGGGGGGGAIVTATPKTAAVKKRKMARRPAMKSGGTVDENTAGPAKQKKKKTSRFAPDSIEHVLTSEDSAQSWWYIVPGGVDGEDAQLAVRGRADFDGRTLTLTAFPSGSSKEPARELEPEQVTTTPDGMVHLEYSFAVGGAGEFRNEVIVSCPPLDQPQPKANRRLEGRLVVPDRHWGGESSAMFMFQKSSGWTAPRTRSRGLRS